MNNIRINLLLGAIGIVVIIANYYEKNTYLLIGGIVNTVFFLLRALYLFLLKSEKGRLILKRLPFKWLHVHIDRYELGDHE